MLLSLSLSLSLSLFFHASAEVFAHYHRNASLRSACTDIYHINCLMHFSSLFLLLFSNHSPHHISMDDEAHMNLMLSVSISYLLNAVDTRYEQYAGEGNNFFGRDVTYSTTNLESEIPHALAT